MRWFLYNRAVAMKDMGERLRWDWLISLGLKLRERVIRYGKTEQPGKDN
jgi:hypothetical protein